VLPSAGVVIAGGSNTTSSGTAVEASADLYTPYTLMAGLHPKYMVVNIQYAPPGSGSTLTYSDATTVGTSTATDSSFTAQVSASESVGINLGLFKFKDTVTETWSNMQDSTSTYSLSNQSTYSDIVPGPNSSGLGVEHESDVIWIWLNPVTNYTITSPYTFVWNGYGADPFDTNVPNSVMDIIPLSVSQLDGTSPITQDEWDILDRDWDPISAGGSGPITKTDLLTILARDPFATNLSGVGRSTAPTTMPTGSKYPVFDPNIPTHDANNSNPAQCGSRYDFTPGFNTTFPYTQLGSANQAITQGYSLATTTAQTTSTSSSDTYTVGVSYNRNWTFDSFSAGPLGFLDTGCVNPATATTNKETPGSSGNPLDFSCTGSSKPAPSATNTLTASLSLKGSLTWSNKRTSTKNNSTLQTQALSIKNPLASDNYTGPEQMQVWFDNLYGTYMFYPKPSDTSWTLMSPQSAVTSGSTVTLTVYVTADMHIPAAPTGTVTFYDGCTILGSGIVDVATGSVSINPPLTGSGQHTIEAIYGGDSNYFHNNSNSIAITVQ
jgi:hypothetical protein